MPVYAGIHFVDSGFRRNDNVPKEFFEQASGVLDPIVNKSNTRTKGSTCAMKESMNNNKIISAMVGVLVIGGITALVKLVNSTKDIERSFEFAAKEGDEDIFI